jgi:hypothetical protein
MQLYLAEHFTHYRYEVLGIYSSKTVVAPIAFLECTSKKVPLSPQQDLHKYAQDSAEMIRQYTVVLLMLQELHRRDTPELPEGPCSSYRDMVCDA